MPEMDGLEVTARIRAQEQASGRRVPILAMTAHVMRGDKERCLESGMDAYISKPLDAAELFSAIDQLVRRDNGPRPETVTYDRVLTKEAARNNLVAGV